jgi:CDP-diacylglycerol--glycerol-3-phosphate 3-phosphatidyltransferase
MWPRDRFWTVPNVLSLSRLLLLPLFFYAVDRPPLYGLAALLVAYGIVSDLLDGYLARRLNQASDWGRLLDPVADKIIIAAGFLFCYLAREMPLWIVLVVIGRDAVILAAVPFLLKRQKRPPQSNLPGRLAALSVALLAAAYIFRLEIWQTPLLTLCVGFVALSLVSYARRLFIHAANTLDS